MSPRIFWLLLLLNIALLGVGVLCLLTVLQWRISLYLSSGFDLRNHWCPYIVYGTILCNTTPSVLFGPQVILLLLWYMDALLAICGEIHLSTSGDWNISGPLLLSYGTPVTSNHSGHSRHMRTICRWDWRKGYQCLWILPALFNEPLWGESGARKNIRQYHILSWSSLYVIYSCLLTRQALFYPGTF